MLRARGKGRTLSRVVDSSRDRGGKEAEGELAIAAVPAPSPSPPTYGSRATPPRAMSCILRARGSEGHPRRTPSSVLRGESGVNTCSPARPPLPCEVSACPAYSVLGEGRQIPSRAPEQRSRASCARRGASVPARSIHTAAKSPRTPYSVPEGREARPHCVVVILRGERDVSTHSPARSTPLRGVRPPCVALRTPCPRKVARRQTPSSVLSGERDISTRPLDPYRCGVSALPTLGTPCSGRTPDTLERAARGEGRQ
jgi:hypothetical protein